MIVVPVVIAFLAVVAIAAVVSYNGLVRTKNQVENAWAQIAVQLKRRYDLIPNLVETVKGYAAHESGTLEAVVKARNAAMSAGGSGAAKAQAESALTGTLKSIFALSESYPDLKANQNFLALQEELTSTENKVAYARQFFNDAVLRFNNAIAVFPRNLIAGAMHLAKREFFEADAEAAAPVSVKF